mmetsp:Transcript_2076/g.5526  ORF Transcript_2076/g.5526 Transcript_2076/m.5526 type:complete len:348 (-) Transcript_2076:326-1369(-)
MPSFQNSAPGAKSMKFADALNPFTPFFAQPGDEPPEEDPTPLTEQFDSRLRLDASSRQQLLPEQQQQQQQQQKHYYEEPEPTVPEPRPPTAYEAISRTIENKKQKKKKSQTHGERDISDDEADDDNDNNNNNSNNDDETSDDDDEFDYLLDDDDDAAVLQAIRQKRLRELQTAHQTVERHKGNGHGELRTISQDEFLAECTSSKHVVVHFFHSEFRTCEVMDHKLKRIASHPRHLSCKFVRIDAEKAPFFVVRLKIQTLPTVIVFENGQSVERLVGFEGLVPAESVSVTNNSVVVDDFPIGRLGYWLESTGAIEYDGPDSDDDNDNETADREKNTRRSRNKVYDVDV